MEILIIVGQVITTVAIIAFILYIALVIFNIIHSIKDDRLDDIKLKRDIKAFDGVELGEKLKKILALKGKSNNTDFFEYLKLSQEVYEDGDIQNEPS